MAFAEGFPAAGGEHAVDGLARVRQPEGEEIAGHQLAGQAHGHVTEVDLRFLTGQVSLRDERFQWRLAGLDQDLGLPAGDVISHHPVGDVRPVLLDQPLEDPGDRVPLLARRVQVRPQDLVDNRLVRVQRGGSGRQLLTRLWPGRIPSGPSATSRRVCAQAPASTCRRGGQAGSPRTARPSTSAA